MEDTTIGKMKRMWTTTTSKEKLPAYISEQVWLWPYEAPGIVGSELYAITVMCGPKNMSHQKYVLNS